MAEEKIYEISLDQIEVSDSNIRHSDIDKDLEELTASIQRHGLLQPVVLVGNYGKPRYKLIVGQRRFLAHKRLRKETIRAVFAGKLTDVQAAIRSLAENMHRVEVNHADAAEAVTELYRHFGRDERRVVQETGMSLRRVRQYIDIEERASKSMKQKLKAKQVTPVDVQRVLRAAAGDIHKADKLLEKMEEYKLTSYQKERVAEYGEKDPKTSVDVLIKEGRRPRVDRSISVRLSDQARKGLARASEALAMEPKEVASRALEDWLSRQGFM